MKQQVNCNISEKKRLYRGNAFHLNLAIAIILFELISPGIYKPRRGNCNFRKIRTFFSTFWWQINTFLIIDKLKLVKNET